MPQSQDPGPGSHSVLIFLLGLFLLTSPFTAWWMTAGAPWYFVFLCWFVLILLSAGLARRLMKHHDT
ncbi:membrane protein implicated in regulation of membrane protease activity [Natronocella acetinitrilica]|uniref:Membrane protein implicated in regulation of membrane protease activity n=1 Tax=Natronocella acetinitrilica TaxID=414046 RepID=A0AAE3KBK5_9GAMM|nr:hypothetical protein [Natronocella acetinitrilica]MCP1674766.1 membrane protein implicated in regulation of membrane protease activity [Natronocella acetinitrilica]